MRLPAWMLLQLPLPMLEGGSPGITGVAGRLPLPVLAACRASLTAFTAACDMFA